MVQVEDAHAGGHHAERRIQYGILFHIWPVLWIHSPGISTRSCHIPGLPGGIRDFVLLWLCPRNMWIPIQHLGAVPSAQGVSNRPPAKNPTGATALQAHGPEPSNRASIEPGAGACPPFWGPPSPSSTSSKPRGATPPTSNFPEVSLPSVADASKLE